MKICKKKKKKQLVFLTTFVLHLLIFPFSTICLLPTQVIYKNKSYLLLFYRYLESVCPLTSHTSNMKDAIGDVPPDLDRQALL